MDFTKFTQKAKELWKKWVAGWVAAWKMSLKAWKNAKDNAMQFTEKSIRSSRFIIKDAGAFKKCIEDSREKTFTDVKTWEVKKFNKTSLIFICEENSEFTRSLLFKLPIVFTKSFSQNIQFGLVLWDIEGIVFSDYSSEKIPFLILFENTAVKKVIHWEENIQKVVNSLNLDINKAINELQES